MFLWWLVLLALTTALLAIIVHHIINSPYTIQVGNYFIVADNPTGFGQRCERKSHSVWIHTSARNDSQSERTISI